MNFYEHRFDFLRVANTGFTGANASDFNEYKKACEVYCLPLKKDTITIPELGEITVGEDNIVEGSTCFYINTGDLFIYKKIYDIEQAVPEYFAWVKVGAMSDDNEGIYYSDVVEYINPYYDSGDVG